MFDDNPDHAIDVGAGTGVVMPPGRVHRVDIGEPVAVALEFHREHHRTDPAHGADSTGLVER